MMTDEPGRRLLLPTLGATMLRDEVDMTVTPMTLDAARRAISEDGYECAIANRRFAELVLRALDLDLTQPSSRKRVRLHPGDEAILVSIGTFVDPDEVRTDRDVADLADGLVFTHVLVRGE